MIEPVIFHGTPMTPRAALQDELPGRAACVSFYYPKDLEALLAICPWLMFRSRGILVLDGRDARRAGMGRGKPARMVVAVLSVARADYLSPRAICADARQSRRTLTDQRRSAERLAVRHSGCSGLSHGCPGGATGAAMRSLLPCRSRMDRTSQAGAGRMRRISTQNGRDRRAHGQRLAPAAHAARDSRGMGLPVRQRGCDLARAERVAV